MTACLTYEEWLAALCLWREARGEPLEARRAVCHVLLNRLADKRWPNDLPGVILQRRQFSSFTVGDPNAVKFPMAGDHAFEDCASIVQAPGEDPTGGANHYESCPDSAEPSWAIAPCYRVGAFEFYRL